MRIVHDHPGAVLSREHSGTQASYFVRTRYDTPLHGMRAERKHPGGITVPRFSMMHRN